MASARAVSSIRPPRDTLTTYAPRFIRASAAASSRWWVASVSGTCRERTSAAATTSPAPISVTPRVAASSAEDAGSWATTEKPMAPAAVATRRPIRPRPINPTVCACGRCSDIPSRPSPNVPARTPASHATSRRVKARMKAIACAATSWKFASGTLVTWIPALVAASTSTTSTPMPQRWMTLQRVSSAISGARIGSTATIRASASRAASARASGEPSGTVTMSAISRSAAVMASGGVIDGLVMSAFTGGPPRRVGRSVPGRPWRPRPATARRSRRPAAVPRRGSSCWRARG